MARLQKETVFSPPSQSYASYQTNYPKKPKIVFAAVFILWL